jgi:hypothetical protein
MFGCWRRSWIRFADGTTDRTSQVIWLQTESMLVDVRIPGDRPDLSTRRGFADCSFDDLAALARTDASSGYTECGAVSPGADGSRTATACWHTRGHGVNYQPVSAFPEPGIMTWSEDGMTMIEEAPSGAYTEEWRLVPHSREPLSVAPHGAGQLYRAGGVAVFVRDRAVAIPRPARLPELLDEYHHDRAFLTQLLDCEFSVAEQGAEGWTITASTLPWREGERLDVDLP